LSWQDNAASDASDFFLVVLLALGKNAGFKTLKVKVCESMDESLSTVIESLELGSLYLTDDNSNLWGRALIPFSAPTRFSSL
jgi:hypothetical protein